MKMAKALLVAITAAFIQPAFANGSYVGTIQELWAGDSVNPDIGWIQIPSLADAHACANGLWFIMDLTTERAKIQYSTAMAAIMAGKTVRLFGTGACNGNFEWLRAIVIVG